MGVIRLACAETRRGIGGLHHLPRIVYYIFPEPVRGLTGRK
jgi:hypothetical protein